MAWDYIDDAISKNKDGKHFFTAIKRKYEKSQLDNSFYVDSKWNGKTKVLIKITDKKMIQSIHRTHNKIIVDENKSKGFFDIVDGLFKARIQVSGGLRGTGRLDRAGVKTSNPSNDDQENGTIFSIVYYSKNHKMPTLREVSEHVKYDFSSEWEHNYQQQVPQVEKYIGKSKLGGYDILLDSGPGRHNVLFEYAAKLGITDRKDNWNPSDIWLIKKNLNKAKIVAVLKEFTHYEQVNAYLERMFESKEIVGVSLKKIELSSKGKSVVVTTKNANFQETFEAQTVKLDPFLANVLPEAKVSSGATFIDRMGFKASKSTISVSVEGRMKGEAVQLGAVSAQLFPSLIKKYTDISPNDIMTRTTKKDANNRKRFERLVSYVVNSKIFKTDTKNMIMAQYDNLADGDGVEDDKLLRRAFNLTLYAAAFASAHKKGNSQKLFSDSYYSAKKQNPFSSIHLKVY